MSESITYTGSLSVYFPCKLRKSIELSRLNKRWDRCRKHQVRQIRSQKQPMTELMDNDLYRQENEFLLSILQNLIQDSDNIDLLYSPYATRCIQCVYRSAREDNIFAKNASVVLSKFQIEYKDIKQEAILLLNINLDNNVATLILVIDLNNKSANDIIRLKHILYNRTLVSIKVFHIERGVCRNGEQKFNCLSGEVNDIVERITIQDFIMTRYPVLVRGRYTYYDIDFRARYSILELSASPDSLKQGTCIPLSELYGILTADEGYDRVPFNNIVNTFARDLSTRKDYSFYMCGLNALIVNYNKCKNTKSLVADNENCYKHHIMYDVPSMSCIPGIEKEIFPSFLKAVELYHLINMEMTNEIDFHGRSYLNPAVFLKRMIHLWNILYELDVNRYHINNDILSAFGIYESLDSIRQEYRDLLQHTMNFIMAFIALVTVILTCAQICK